uniref:long-chain-fatty-acid--CoA ligase n=1 Tax=Dermatophagoides pteronyssinus TaxID=6956 RepID=A0A6P6YF90_DERPT|nr:long-chain-fatty-acid--CoA ligase 4-like [Dermatophagoides pteronyssinus]
MSNLMVKIALLNTKLVVNAYTAVTLPFYTIYQRPWQKLRAMKSFAVRMEKDKHGRIIYSRQAAIRPDHKYFHIDTYSKALTTLNRDEPKIGQREIISEELQYDQNGQPIMVEGRPLTKIKLSDYKWWTVGQILDRADAIARGLQQLGVKKGDKVMIYAESNVEWFLVTLALNRLCAVTVTLFSTLGDSGVLYGLNQSESEYLIIGESLLQKIDKLQDQLQYIKKIVYIPNSSNSYKSRDPKIKASKEKVSKKYSILSLEQLEKNGNNIQPYTFPDPKPDDLMLIMYTSGTTGDPKGVMVTHKNFMEFCKNLLRRDLESPIKLIRSRNPGFLPMAHMFGYISNLSSFLSDGDFGLSSPVTLLSSSPTHVEGQKGDMDLLQPLSLMSVPLVLEKLLSEIYRRLNSRSSLATPLFSYLMDYKIRWRSRGYDTPIINRLVCQRINEQFGGRLKLMVIGSAAIDERTHKLATAALNATCIMNGYGSTEMGVITIMTQNDLSFGRTGVPVENMKFYLDDWNEGGYSVNDKPNPRGEIIGGGDQVALGYYKKPEETAKDFFVDEEGCRWFRSGDIGEIFPDGTLKIIDRKKDLVKLSNGEFISLGKIEAGLRTSGYVDNICIVTDPFRNDVIALIRPNRPTLMKLAAELKRPLDYEQLCDDPIIIQKVLESIQKKCQELNYKKPETPVKIALVKEEWTQENNLLTAAFKLRRKPVMDFYRDLIKQMFSEIDKKV